MRVLICEYCGKLLKKRQKRYCCIKCSASSRNKNKTEETLQKLRDNCSGWTHTEQAKQKIGEASRRTVDKRRGWHHTEEAKKKIGEASRHMHDNYVYDPSKEQSEYRRKAIETYGYQCMICGECRGLLHVHHIDGNHDNDDINNLSVLCNSCHSKAHGTGGSPIPEIQVQLLEIKSKLDKEVH